MRVLVAGSSGLIGTALLSGLRARGDEVVRLVRREVRSADERRWDPPSGRIDHGAFDDVDAVVNLCGSPLASGRWSAARKQLLRDSRIEPTEVLAEAVAEHRIPVLLSASGVHYYGDTHGTEVDESAAAGTGFLAQLCAEWESVTAPAADAGARVVLLRTAPVLARRGGLLRLMAPVFRLGLGATFGTGRQYLPWISLTDAVAVAMFCLDRDDISGPVNVTVPEPATNAELTRALGRAVRRPTPWRVPANLLRLALGDAAEETLLTGPRPVPGVLLDTGFRHSHTELDEALAAVLADPSQAKQVRG